MILGIDISHHQGRGSWPSRIYDVEFAYIKASEGETFRDPLFVEHAHKAQIECNLFAGAYHVLRSPEGERFAADDQADLFDAQTTKLPFRLKLPPALDCETKHVKRLVADYGRELAAAFVNDMLFRLARDSHLVPTLYTSRRGIRALGGAEAITVPVRWWLADYKAHRLGRSSPRPITGVSWSFWQFTSEGDGKRYGFASDGLDLNYFRGKWSDLMAMGVPMLDKMKRPTDDAPVEDS
jgi:lysozyme